MKIKTPIFPLLIISFCFSTAVNATPWKKYISGKTEDMWVLKNKPKIDASGVVYAPFFDVNKDNRTSNYSDLFGNKFVFDATIRHVYINCTYRQMALTSTEYYKDNNLIFTENNKFKNQILSSEMGVNTIWQTVSFGDFYGKAFEYYCNN